TELDMSLYIPGMTYTSDQFYTPATFTDALEQQQADRYFQFFQLFRAYKSVITGVTLWGIADDATWLSMFSSGRKDFPLLFDTNHNPKPAFWAVVDFSSSPQSLAFLSGAARRSLRGPVAAAASPLKFFGGSWAYA